MAEPGRWASRVATARPAWMANVTAGGEVIDAGGVPATVAGWRQQVRQTDARESMSGDGSGESGMRPMAGAEHAVVRSAPTAGGASAEVAARERVVGPAAGRWAERMGRVTAPGGGDATRPPVGAATAVAVGRGAGPLESMAPGEPVRTRGRRSPAEERERVREERRARVAVSR